MRVVGRLLVISLGFLIAVVIHAQLRPDDAIANAFYPQVLDELFRRNLPAQVPVVRRSTSVRVDLDRSGYADYLAIAYSNGLACRLRVVKGSSLADSTLIAESPDDSMAGHGGPQLEAVDIDHDGVPELVVRFIRATWVYKYEGGQLVLYGPTLKTRHGLTSALSDASFIDVDGDGVLEILDNTATGRGTGGVDLYKRSNSGTFARVDTVEFSEHFARAEVSGAAQPTSHSFRAAPGKYVLHVVRSDMTAAGEIRLNGVVIALPSDFRLHTRALNIPVELRERNDLSVAVDGDVGAQVTVMIVPTRP